MIDDLTKKIHQWGLDRKIIQNSTALAQTRKTIEEVHELIEAAAMLELWTTVLTSINKDEPKESLALKDALGDVYVTLCMVAGCAGLSMEDCITHAYDEIKDRTGTLRKDGVFVKDSE